MLCDCNCHKKWGDKEGVNTTLGRPCASTSGGIGLRELRAHRRPPGTLHAYRRGALGRATRRGGVHPAQAHFVLLLDLYVYDVLRSFYAQRRTTATL